MTQAELAELRAALMQLEKALEIERACVIRIRKVLEKSIENKIVTISENDSLAGIIAIRKAK